MNAYYLQAIKNKVKGEARVVLCTNGNPSTIPEIKRVIMQHYGDKRDIPTNINLLFQMKKSDRTHQFFFHRRKRIGDENEVKRSAEPSTLTPTVR